MLQAKIRRFAPPKRVSRKVVRIAGTAAIPLFLVLLMWLPLSGARAFQSDPGYSPVRGNAQVIAQGVVELPQGQAVWRTVRARAAGSSQATFEAQSLGFVFASSSPLLLVDGKTGEQTRLGVGEGAFVQEGALQQRSSLTNDAVTYLAIELVSSSVASPVGGTVLETGDPFAAPSGQRDLDLLADALAIGESLTIPDSGAENILLVTGGAAAVTSPNGDSEVLLAGEAATFAGERLVSPAPDSDAPVSILAAIIGPEVPELTLPSRAAELSPVPAATAVSGPDVGEGSITLQVYACPPGMTGDRIDITACAVINDGFDVAISSPKFEQPLTLDDADISAAGFTWNHLPFGDYEITETALPAGASSYVLAARGAGGRISIDAAQPAQSVRIYNFSP